ncbi:MAG TPA: hypothetical protein VM680_17280 [Verrucomicrobiae bacterium]|nr:hypothetical protein [Verrucomicrobiae bacterium]
MVRRFYANLQVNLAGGFVLFFFSERLFWTVFKPADRIVDLVITWLAYSVLACVFLNILKRCRASELPRVALSGGVFGWLAEGALVGTLYGTESSAPFPLSIVQTALSWHMLLTVVVGWHFLTRAIRQGALIKTALISVGVGLFWAAWAPFQWRETPPVIVPVWTFVVHAVVTGALLSIACGILSGSAWDRYKPGWLGLGLSALILAVFYSEQIKRLGVRPVIVLPLLSGGVLALLCWTKEKSESPDDCARNSERWKCAATTLVIPLIASLGYVLQRFTGVSGIPPAWIFNGLAFVGGAFFLIACGMVIRKRTSPARAFTAP